LAFLKECCRVLKPGGVLRVVVPDLENIAAEYVKNVKECLENPTPLAEANYDWILLEMYDQVVRNHSGGDMAEYLRQEPLPNERYIIERLGAGGQAIIDAGCRKGTRKSLREKWQRMTLRKLWRYPGRAMKALFSSHAQKIGAFRLGGEVHLWMYDRFSL